MDVYEKIVKDCFWDTKISPEEILTWAQSPDERLRNKLFARIIKNSTDRLYALQIFSEELLPSLFTTYKSEHTHAQSDRDFLALENVLAGTKNFIRGAQWKK